MTKNIEALSGQKVLVTGGAGFIGSHLTDALIELGAHVTVLDNLSSGKRENLEQAAGKAELVVGDIRDFELVTKLCDGVDTIFHQAAMGSVPRSLKTPLDTLSNNVHGTATIFTAARDAGVRRVVYASSSSVYGDSETLPKREGEEGKKLSPYAMSKHMDEELAEIYTRCFDMEFVGLRYFNVYGPRQDPHGAYAAVIPRYFEACKRGEAPLIYGDGEQSRDFTFVADAVQANLKAAVAGKDATGRAYNIGAGGRTTVNELARTIIELSGASVEPRHEPPRVGDIRHSKADTSAAKALLGYEATRSIAEGLGVAQGFYLRD